jgi:hypothetical protein
MNLEPEQFGQAFSYYEACHLRAGFPVEEWWRKALPSIDPGEFPALLARIKEIEIFTFALCEQVLNNELTLKGAFERLQQEYPSVSGNRLLHFLRTVHSLASERREASKIKGTEKPKE